MDGRSGTAAVAARVAASSCADCFSIIAVMTSSGTPDWASWRRPVSTLKSTVSALDIAAMSTAAPRPPSTRGYHVFVGHRRSLGTTERGEREHEQTTQQDNALRHSPATVGNRQHQLLLSSWGLHLPDPGENPRDGTKVLARRADRGRGPAAPHTRHLGEGSSPSRTSGRCHRATGPGDWAAARRLDAPQGRTPWRTAACSAGSSGWSARTST